jgi:ABC-type glutathione transport system ATPase component
MRKLFRKSRVGREAGNFARSGTATSASQAEQWTPSPSGSGENQEALKTENLVVVTTTERGDIDPRKPHADETAFQQSYSRPENVPLQDVSSFYYELEAPASQPVLAMPLSPSFGRPSDGLELTSTLFTKAPSENVYEVQQTSPVWSMTSSPGPMMIETSPEATAISSKDEDSAIDKIALKPTVVAVLGLTGAGKSTFIRNVTGCEDVKVGHGYRSGKNL